MACRPDDLIGPDLQQTLVWLAMMRKRSNALRMPQRNRLIAERSGAAGIRGTEQADNRHRQRRSQMQGTGIPAKCDTRAAGEGDQLPDGAAHGEGISTAGR